MNDKKLKTNFLLVAISKNNISFDVVRMIKSSLKSIYGLCPTLNRLGDNAIEFYIDDKNLEITQYLRLHFNELQIDFNIVPSLNRKKLLLLADMDATLIQNECIDELAAYWGVENQIKIITDNAMSGDIVFVQSLVERVALLKGLPIEVLDSVYKNNIRLNPGAEVLGRTLKNNNIKSVIVSGGFDFFASKIANKISFNCSHSNYLETKNGVLTGRIKGKILCPTAKQHWLEFYQKEMKITSAQTLCVGDGANDINMIKATNMGVAYHAKPKLVQEASYIINHSDLKALLYLQGYKQSKFFN